MPRRLRSSLCLLAALCLLLNPASGIGDSRLAAPGHSARAALDFRIIIPPMIELLENSHPGRIDVNGAAVLSAWQQLTVASNMKRGFCLHLSLSAAEVSGWRLQSTPGNGITITPLGQGYRLCSSRPGRYTLRLLHQFDITATNGGPASLRWPVQTDLVAL
ncbi:hypothetical protein [Hydrogenophaga sp.]|uniref:hypothetical protein n=1 Tax=Hydrogenophaga sp. TaxID=1904254 RepID=UPI0019A9C982|nr:hypothetical protein [Hydrogenophaga sp.]MBD3893138.1 hypothetical protein [Hydrogenophaga sp.]